MNNEDKDRARCTKLYCAIVEVLGSSGCKNPTEEALSIVNWVNQEILKDRSKTLLWVAELIKTEHSKPDDLKPDDLPFIRIISQIAKEMISNELDILRGEVSELKEEIIDEGKC